MKDMETIYVKSAWTWDCPECGSLQACHETIGNDGIDWRCTECNFVNLLKLPKLTSENAME